MGGKGSSKRETNHRQPFLTFSPPTKKSSTKNAFVFIDDDDLKTIDRMGSGHIFNRVHRAARALAISTFAHLPSGVVQIADNVKVDEWAAEISNKMFTMFEELQTQKAGFGWSPCSQR
ncbi:hypothetical protein GGX14DRAFT_389524 [Mycena pura]|uniref:Uncharacterized protein n=1 Tax=Mycena pura TaxID=153505 RepID=A0AAD6VWP3_9AGAR|nr:hypothetical protein GGX14DRAFT_389524 [Mycena pura]